LAERLPEAMDGRGEAAHVAEQLRRLRRRGYAGRLRRDGCGGARGGAAVLEKSARMRLGFGARR
jgi:hypothetical protein